MADPTLAAVLQAAQNGRFNVRLDQPPHEPWAWTKDYPGMAKALSDTLQYGPMAMGSRAGAGMGRDSAMAHQLDHRRMGYAADDVAGPRAETLRNFAPNSMRDYARPGGKQGMVAWPEEVEAWGRQVPANVNAPRIPELTNPAGGRLMQALDNGGKAPTVDLPTSPDLVARYLATLTGPGRRPSGEPPQQMDMRAVQDLVARYRASLDAHPRGGNVIEGPWGAQKPAPLGLLPRKD